MTHASILKRLRRAEGHLRSLVSMFDSGRDCLELVQQLHAVEAALANAKKELIHEHLDHCMEEALAKGSMSATDAVAQMRALTKYL